MPSLRTISMAVLLASAMTPGPVQAQPAAVTYIHAGRLLAERMETITPPADYEKLDL